jgi:hypothetical protein
LPLNEATTGVFRSVCWIPGEDLAKPTMAAIGTSSGGILIVEPKTDGTAPILRRFRGHTSEVTSLAVSRDLRWLHFLNRSVSIRPGTQYWFWTDSSSSSCGTTLTLLSLT